MAVDNVRCGVGQAPTVQRTAQVRERINLQGTGNCRPFLRACNHFAMNPTPLLAVNVHRRHSLNEYGLFTGGGPPQILLVLGL